MNKHKVARALGWFSMALGAAEMFAPKKLSRALGVGKHNKLIRGFGLREMMAGVGLLKQRRSRGKWLWARVAGDALDIGALALATPRSHRRKAVMAALGSVVAVTAVDAIFGYRMTRNFA